MKTSELLIRGKFLKRGGRGDDQKTRLSWKEEECLPDRGKGKEKVHAREKARQGGKMIRILGRGKVLGNVRPGERGGPCMRIKS